MRQARRLLVAASTAATLLSFLLLKESLCQHTYTHFHGGCVHTHTITHTHGHDHFMTEATHTHRHPLAELERTHDRLQGQARI